MSPGLVTGTDFRQTPNHRQDDMPYTWNLTPLLLGQENQSLTSDRVMLSHSVVPSPESLSL